MLIMDLKHWEKNGFQLYLFAENPKQLERLYSIFTDLKAEINFNPIATSIHEGFIDEDLKIVCYTDHEIFQRYHKYNIRQAYNKSKAITLRTLRELQPGDYVTHIDHGVGVYSGLQKIENNGKLQEAVRIIYKDTPDQSKATADVKKDMESLSPMDRLVCGDVGFGKTEIAIRGAFKTCVDGKQAAILVPTTILAFQHYQTFSERLKDFPVTVDYVNRFKSSKEKKETLQKLHEGKIDIIIGTHALMGKEVKYKDLGLRVAD